MRRRFLWFMLIATVFLCTGFALAGEDPSLTMQVAEWSWEDDSVSVFEGTAAFSEAPSQKVILRFSHEAMPSSAESGEVVFLSANGKQLTLRKQLPEMTFPADGSAELHFSGCWKCPSKADVFRVNITLQAVTEDGNILAEKTLTVENESGEPPQAEDVRYRIPMDLDQWILWLFLAAAAVWAAAILRIIINQKRGKRG
ncbi:MAG: hypothetical protein IKQ45_02200 [Clostridia bacterium]|nr:hypothetical protein [Clostridia bacterium]